MKKILFFALIFVFLFVNLHFISACINLTDMNQYNVTNSTTLCTDTYYMNVSGYNPALLMNASNIVLDCNGSTIFGNETGIGIEFDRSMILNNVTIKNCNITNYTEGISDYGTAGAAGAGNDTTIYNNTIHVCGRGISMNAPTGIYGDFNITRNNLTNISIVGIKITGYTNGGYISNNGFENIVGAGIWMWYINNTIIQYNNISNIDDGSSIECHTGSGSAGDCYNTGVYNNTLSENSGNANAWEGNGIFIRGGTFNIDGNNMSSNFNYGSYLRNAKGNFTNNNILKSIGTGIGFYLYEVNYSKIHANVINGSGVDGLRIEECFGNNITNLTSRFNGYRGIYLVNTNRDNRIYHNNFTNNTILPMDTYASSCANSVFNNSALNGFDLYFENGSSSLSNLEIQQLILCNLSESSLSGINMTNSYGVRVFGGSNVNLTDFNISTNVNQAAISLSSSTSKFIVSNSSFSNYFNNYGIILGGSNHTIQSCNIENVNDTGIYVTSDDSVVRESLIQNTSLYGITIISGERNTFYYNNITNTSDFGIYETGGIGNNISNNRIYNIINTSAAFVYGIYSTVSNSLTIENNYLYNNCEQDSLLCGAMMILTSNSTINSNHIFNDTNTSGSTPVGIYITSYKNDEIIMNNNEINCSPNNGSYGMLVLGAEGIGENELIISSSGNVIRNAGYGISIDDVNLSFANSSIFNASINYAVVGWVSADNGSLTFTNMTGLNVSMFNVSGTGNLIVNEYVRAQAQDSAGANIAGVVVTLRDNESTALWTDTTTALPTAYHLSRIYMQNSTASLDYSSLTATGINTGYTTGTVTQDISNTTTMIITMSAVSSGTTDSSGGSGPRNPYNFTLTKENLIFGVFKYIMENDGILFAGDYHLNGHRIHIEEVESNRVKLRVFSEPFSFWVNVGKDVKVDVDGDDFYDILVNVEKVISDSARIYFKEVEREEVSEEGTPVSGEGEIVDEESLKDGEKTPTWVWIVIIISVLIGIGAGGKGKGKIKEENIK